MKEADSVGCLRWKACQVLPGVRVGAPPKSSPKSVQRCRALRAAVARECDAVQSYSSP